VFVLIMRDQKADLDEGRIAIKQAINAFSRRELASRVLFGDSRCAATGAKALRQLPEAIHSTPHVLTGVRRIHLHCVQYRLGGRVSGFNTRFQGIAAARNGRFEQPRRAASTRNTGSSE
jgi:hypothetical protein